MLKFKELGYLRNQSILRQYGNVMYRLVRFKTLKNTNVEIVKGYSPKGTINDEKLDNNISRARSKVKEYALCNPWQYFATFTIDGKKYNRFDLELYHKTFAQWLRNYNKKHDTNIKYVVLPETHKNGAWHEHGLIMGLPIEHLRPFRLDEKLPYYIRNKLLNNEIVYNWDDYSEKFGFTDFEPIKSLEKVSNYILKYITKDLSKCVKDINAHMYYVSKGLDTSKVIKKGTISANIAPDFENDYIKINEYLKNQTPYNIIDNIIKSIN